MTKTAQTGQQDQKQRHFVITSKEDALLFCKDCSQTIDAMIHLIERETMHLQKMNIAEAELLHSEKDELASMLHQKISFFRENGRFIHLFAPDALRSLSNRHKHLQKVINSNMELLDALNSSFESLMRKTMKHVPSENAEIPTYSDDATLSEPADDMPFMINRNA
ncbi:MAG: hypothetical protein PSN37_00540 [Alphaproteobacteria bacterium]|nr:hypothetical protein [Alphaproteobacteria bacterium]